MKVKQLFFLLLTGVIFFLISPISSSAEKDSNIKIEQQNVIAFPTDESSLGIVHILLLKNTGTETKEQISIYLPETHTNLKLGQELNPEKVNKTEMGIEDTSGLGPGETKQIQVSYNMPIQGNTAQWAITQPYLSERNQVIIQPGVLSVQAQDLVPQSELFEMNGKKYRRFTSVGIDPGIPWNVSLRLLASPNKETTEEKESTAAVPTGYTEDGLKIIGEEGLGYGKAAFTVIVIITALAAALIGLKRDLQKTTRKPSKSGRKWLVVEKENILHEIVQLENDYHANLVGKQTYETTREQMRNHLIRITTELYRENPR